MIKTKIYAHISSEDAYKKGEEIGLAGEELRLFSYFNEVALEIEVEDTGLASKIKIAAIK